MRKAKTYSVPPSNEMKATTRLHDLGQSLWLDNITRDLLNRGTLAEYSVNGLTSNPTIFEQAIKNRTAKAFKEALWLRRRRLSAT